MGLRRKSKLESQCTLRLDTGHKDTVVEVMESLRSKSSERFGDNNNKYGRHGPYI